MRSTSRPLGGITALTLGVVSAEGTAPSLPEQGAQFRLLEDRSTYSRHQTWSEGELSEQHTLLLVTPFDFTLPDSLGDGLTQGFVALVSLNSLDQIEVGADDNNRLWLSSCTTCSEENRSSRGYKEWLFETIAQEEETEDEPQEDEESESQTTPNGVTSLNLCAASSDVALPDFDNEGVDLTLFEDLSTYSEKVEFVGAQQSVSHSLLIYTSVDYSLPTALSEALGQGFVAHATLNSSKSIVVGWSEEAGAQRALRLVSCSIACSTKSDGIYYKEWLFESTDGVSNI